MTHLRPVRRLGAVVELYGALRAWQQRTEIGTRQMHAVSLSPILPSEAVSRKQSCGPDRAPAWG